MNLVSEPPQQTSTDEDKAAAQDPKLTDVKTGHLAPGGLNDGQHPLGDENGDQNPVDGVKDDATTSGDGSNHQASSRGEKMGAENEDHTELIPATETTQSQPVGHSEYSSGAVHIPAVSTTSSSKDKAYLTVTVPTTNSQMLTENTPSPTSTSMAVCGGVTSAAAISARSGQCKCPPYAKPYVHERLRRKTKTFC